MICESNDTQPQTLKIAGPCMIMNHCIMFSMLHTIKLNHQFCLAAIKVDNISRKLFLPAKLIRMMLQKLIPQTILVICTFPAKRLSPCF